MRSKWSWAWTHLQVYPQVFRVQLAVGSSRAVDKLPQGQYKLFVCATAVLPEPPVPDLHILGFSPRIFDDTPCAGRRHDLRDSPPVDRPSRGQVRGLAEPWIIRWKDLCKR